VSRPVGESYSLTRNSHVIKSGGAIELPPSTPEFFLLGGQTLLRQPQQLILQATKIPKSFHVCLPFVFKIGVAFTLTVQSFSSLKIPTAVLPVTTTPAMISRAACSFITAVRANLAAKMLDRLTDAEFHGKPISGDEERALVLQANALVEYGH
jgi:hypothetical protein